MRVVMVEHEGGVHGGREGVHGGREGGHGGT